MADNALYYPPPPPFIGGFQPYAPRLLPPSITAVAVNNPPFSHRARLEQQNAIYIAWIPDPTPHFFTGGRQALAGFKSAASLSQFKRFYFHTETTLQGAPAPPAGSLTLSELAPDQTDGNAASIAGGHNSTSSGVTTSLLNKPTTKDETGTPGNPPQDVPPLAANRFGWFSDVKYTGRFESGNWTFRWREDDSNAGVTGSPQINLYASKTRDFAAGHMRFLANIQGATDWWQGAANTAVWTSGVVGPFDLSNEYLFVQLWCHETVLAAGNTLTFHQEGSDLTDATRSNLATTNFSPRVSFDDPPFSAFARSDRQFSANSAAWNVDQPQLQATRTVPQGAAAAPNVPPRSTPPRELWDGAEFRQPQRAGLNPAFEAVEVDAPVPSARRDVLASWVAEFVLPQRAPFAVQAVFLAAAVPHAPALPWSSWVQDAPAAPQRAPGFVQPAAAVQVPRPAMMLSHSSWASEWSAAPPRNLNPSLIAVRVDAPVPSYRRDPVTSWAIEPQAPQRAPGLVPIAAATAGAVPRSAAAPWSFWVSADLAPVVAARSLPPALLQVQNPPTPRALDFSLWLVPEPAREARRLNPALEAARVDAVLASRRDLDPSWWTAVPFLAQGRTQLAALVPLSGPVVIAVCTVSAAQAFSALLGATSASASVGESASASATVSP